MKPTLYAALAGYAFGMLVGEERERNRQKEHRSELDARFARAARVRETRNRLTRESA